MALPAASWYASCCQVVISSEWLTSDLHIRLLLFVLNDIDDVV